MGSAAGIAITGSMFYSTLASSDGFADAFQHGLALSVLRRDRFLEDERGALALELEHRDLVVEPRFLMSQTPLHRWVAHSRPLGQLFQFHTMKYET